MTKIVKSLIVEEEKLSELINTTQEGLKKAPDGNLRISINKSGKPEFYHRTDSKDRNGKYIQKKNIDLAKALAQKEYDTRLLAKSKLRRRIIQDFMEKYEISSLNEVYTNTSTLRRNLIDSMGISDEEYVKQWQTVNYKLKGFDDFAPEIYTEKGERVRSKSEKMIADKLYMRGIPYRYEYPLQLKGYGVVHPDFTLLNVSTRQEYILEHLGMMDDEVYCTKAIQKIETYQKCGIYPGEKLLLTFETKTKPINMKVLDGLIDNFLLE